MVATQFKVVLTAITMLIIEGVPYFLADQLFKQVKEAVWTRIMGRPAYV